MASRSRGIRRQALQKIAILAANTAVTTKSAASDAELDRLFRASSLYSRSEIKSDENSNQILESQSHLQQFMV